MLLVWSTTLYSCENALTTKNDPVSDPVTSDFNASGLEASTMCAGCDPVYSPMGNELPGAYTAPGLHNVCFDYSFFAHPFSAVYDGVDGFTPPASPPYHNYPMVQDGSYVVSEIFPRSDFWPKGGGIVGPEYYDKVLILKNGSPLHVMTVAPNEFVYCSHAGPLYTHSKIMDCAYAQDGDQYFKFSLSNIVRLRLDTDVITSSLEEGGWIEVKLAQENEITNAHGIARWEITANSSFLQPEYMDGNFNTKYGTVRVYMDPTATNRTGSITFKDVLNGNQMVCTIHQVRRTAPTITPSGNPIALPHYAAPLTFKVKASDASRNFHLSVDRSGINITKTSNQEFRVSGQMDGTYTLTISEIFASGNKFITNRTLTYKKHGGF